MRPARPMITAQGQAPFGAYSPPDILMLPFTKRVTTPATPQLSSADGAVMGSIVVVVVVVLVVVDVMVVDVVVVVAVVVEVVVESVVEVVVVVVTAVTLFVFAQHKVKL